MTFDRPAHATSVVILFALLAAAWDLRTLSVPNALSLGLLSTGFVYWIVAEGTVGLAYAARGAAVAALLLLIPYLAGATGAGDLKLLSGVGAWLGAAAAFEIFMATAVATTIYAMSLALLRANPRDMLHEIRQFLAIGSAQGDFSIARLRRRDHRRLRIVPFSALLAISLTVPAFAHA